MEKEKDLGADAAAVENGSQMKLSEAIRLGAMATGQAYDVFRDNDGNTCAMGAALVAVGVMPLSGKFDNTAMHMTVASRWGYKFNWPGIPCPVCGSSDNGPVAHLNNVHRWSREQIADWVESIERAQDTPVGCADQPTLEPALTFPSAAQKN